MTKSKRRFCSSVKFLVNLHTPDVCTLGATKVARCLNHHATSW